MVFRYPGGKTKLLKKFQDSLILSPNDDYYEPFVGGGSVLIHIAQKYPKAKLVVNDLDQHIYSFWKLFELNDDSLFAEFYTLIRQQPTLELFQTLRATPAKTLVERAYYAVFFNRTTFSGMFRSGPIGGMEQKSKWKIDCRYTIKNLIKKLDIMRKLLGGRIEVHHLGFEQFINLIPSENAFIYLDPPYYQKGKILYPEQMSPNDHAKLSYCLKDRTNWVLSYDKCSEIIDLYYFADIVDIDANYSINGAKTSWNKTVECIILPKS